MSKNAFISFYAKSKIIDFVRVTNDFFTPQEVYAAVWPTIIATIITLA